MEKDDKNIQEEKDIFFPEGYCHECLQCGKCCRNWQIVIDKNKYQQLINTPFILKMKKKFPESDMVKFYSDQEVGVLGEINNNCIMLDDNLCMIHSEMGCDFKPDVCRKFPFVLTSTPDGIYAGVSYHCLSIQRNKGIRVSEYIQDIKKLLETFKPKYQADNIIKLTDNISVTWEGYLFLEKQLTDWVDTTGVSDATWKMMGMIISLGIIGENIGDKAISVNEMENLLSSPPLPPLKRERWFHEYQFEYASSILSILELWAGSMEERNADIILKGGSLQSDSFEKEIEIKPIEEYVKSHLQEEFQTEFDKYVKHLLWRKYLLTYDTVFTGLVTVNFLPIFFMWYANASLTARDGREMEMDDVKTTLGLLDLYFHHLRLLGRFFRRFGKGLIDQHEILMR
ncbi:MAG: YkgJ family cysteine cluster protein [Candidatus Eremiobacteraeota bacterium]|nr:YkgJ family cysteine cluster protein [Candidatus Eremiobacteraeota bacterium]